MFSTLTDYEDKLTIKAMAVYLKLSKIVKGLPFTMPNEVLSTSLTLWQTTIVLDWSKLRAFADAKLNVT